MSRGTTPGSIGRGTRSHSERSPWERAVGTRGDDSSRSGETAAVWAMKRRRPTAASRSDEWEARGARRRRRQEEEGRRRRREAVAVELVAMGAETWIPGGSGSAREPSSSYPSASFSGARFIIIYLFIGEEERSLPSWAASRRPNPTTCAGRFGQSKARRCMSLGRPQTVGENLLYSGDLKKKLIVQWSIYILFFCGKEYIYSEKK
jgi:hypothetical protein